MPAWIENLVHVLESENIQIAHVLVTHWHGDHTGGIAQLVELYPQLRNLIYKNSPDPGQNDIRDGEVFSVEGATIRALLTPGHSEDHMCFALEEEDALFTGDNILGHGFPVVEDLGVFMTSLKKIQTRNCSKGYPAHGIVIEDLRAKIASYIGRYLRRERQVVAVLKQRLARAKINHDEEVCPSELRKGLTVAELVQQLYGDVSQEIIETALQPSLDETLRKLANDRKVGFELERTAAARRPMQHCKRWFVLVS